MSEGDAPLAAIVLSATGLAFQVAGAAFALMIPRWWGMGYGPWMMAYWWGWGPWAFMLPFAALVIALAAVGLALMGSRDVGWVRVGSVLVLVASVVAFPTMFGFMVGSLLMLVGAILGLTWTPRASPRSP